MKWVMMKWRGSEKSEVGRVMIMMVGDDDDKKEGVYI